MAQMQGGLEAARKKFVKEQAAKGVARDVAMKRFYVQTRVAELQKAGKPVDATVRAQLRKNWETGQVKRAEFGAPKAGPKATVAQNPKGETRRGPEGPGGKSKPLPNKGPVKTREYNPQEWANAGVSPNFATSNKSARGYSGPVKEQGPKRMGPETTSFTKAKPSRTGPESKSFTKSTVAQNPKAPKRRGPEGVGGNPGRALKPSSGNMPGGPSTPSSLSDFFNKQFPWTRDAAKNDRVSQKRREYLLKYGIKGKQAYNLTVVPGGPKL